MGGKEQAQALLAEKLATLPKEQQAYIKRLPETRQDILLIGLFGSALAGNVAPEKKPQYEAALDAMQALSQKEVEDFTQSFSDAENREKVEKATNMFLGREGFAVTGDEQENLVIAGKGKNEIAEIGRDSDGNPELRYTAFGFKVDLSESSDMIAYNMKSHERYAEDMTRLWLTPFTSESIHKWPSELAQFPEIHGGREIDYGDYHPKNSIALVRYLEAALDMKLLKENARQYREFDDDGQPIDQLYLLRALKQSGFLVTRGGKFDLDFSKMHFAIEYRKKEQANPGKVHPTGHAKGTSQSQ
ncbi:hypothetical protein SCOR_27325 [Sulfidibacter corallicola]|uniref:Uncharacterized protein n=1 Tax=Sulfidibacter corallicola TaxID=2818388 RepID=A0A8A4TNE7_SULCO|nr:hypothetical protein [Sulfidibacter corallicola]QTD50734.1 hypothetical protein J3U87_34545 [Sulfidibacter corallicola]